MTERQIDKQTERHTDRQKGREMWRTWVTSKRKSSQGARAWHNISVHMHLCMCVPCMMGVALMAAEESSSAHFCSRSEERRSDIRCSTAHAACMLLVARAR